MDKPKWKNTLSAKEIEDYVGFVYMITEVKTGRYYIGQKKYWFANNKKPLKGKKNRRLGKKESNWKLYWGSSNKLNEHIAKVGTKGFERKILKHCKTQFDLSYTELEWQVKMNALFDPLCWNELIRVRLVKIK